MCSNVGSGQNIRVADKQIDSIKKASCIKKAGSVKNAGSIKHAAYDVFAWGTESNGLYYTESVSRDSTLFFYLDPNTVVCQLPLKREDPAQSTARGILDTGSDKPKILWHKLNSPQGKALFSLSYLSL